MKQLVNTLFGLHIQLFKPVALLHESCHYVAARILGFRVKFSSYYFVTFYPERTDWRVFVVILAPALIGVFGMIIFGVFVLFLNGWFLLLPSSVNFLLWEGMCASDLANTVHYFRHGRWADEIYQTPMHPDTIGCAAKLAK